MEPTTADDPTRVVGRFEAETRHLEQQAELFARPMRRLFEEAGIATDRPVLDVRSGPAEPVIARILPNYFFTKRGGT